MLLNKEQKLVLGISELFCAIPVAFPAAQGRALAARFFQIARGLTQNARIAVVAFFATGHGETYREAYYLK